MSELEGNDYAGFLVEIKARIRQAQYQALRAVNKDLLSLYWDIGESIHRKQEALGWGKAVVENLACDLQAEFPGQNGFSAANLWLMRQFYTEYRDRPILEPLVREISWSKNVLVMKRCKDVLEREFYLRATARFGWTKAVLQHQIDNKSYEKHLLNQTNFDATLPTEIKAQAAQAVKDHYTFDFLDLAEEHSERELERALVGSDRRFGQRCCRYGICPEHTPGNHRHPRSLRLYVHFGVCRRDTLCGKHTGSSAASPTAQSW